VGQFLCARYSQCVANFKAATRLSSEIGFTMFQSWYDARCGIGLHMVGSRAAGETVTLSAPRPSRWGGSQSDCAGETGALCALGPSPKGGSQAAGQIGVLGALRPSPSGGSQSDAAGETRAFCAL